MSASMVLVAEDSDLLRFVTKRQLAALGVACDGARDGEEALQMWHRDPSRYWLLLTDLEMPQLDGFGLARAIRSAFSAGARLPIVAYTANHSFDDSQRCRRAGIDECLAKPAELRCLNDVLHRWSPETAWRRTGS